MRCSHKNEKKSCYSQYLTVKTTVYMSLFASVLATGGAIFLALSTFPFSAGLSLANPEGGTVSAGSAAITQVPGTTTIHQNSDKAVIDWRAFNIGSNEKTQFQQPSASSITLNRVDPNHGSSNIQGQLSANGQVWIMNPAGIIFGSTARVDVGGLIATTAGISNEDFLAGNFHFVQAPNWHGAVINQGSITIADRGLVGLVAPGVENNGVIRANLGRVALAAGNEFTIDLYGDQLIQFGLNSKVTQPAVDSEGRTLKNGVSNTGSIIASGGTVLITANVAKSVIDNAINMNGYVRATSAVSRNGEIILMGGEGSVRVNGKLLASGKRAGQKGGKVKILGKEIILTDKAKIDVSGFSGGGEVLIGGNAHGIGPLPNANYTLISSQAHIRADALHQGNGGKVIIWSDLGTVLFGSISARGGRLGGNGGFVETSGKQYLNAAGSVTASASQGLPGEWLLDPANVTISTGATTNGSFGGGNPNTFTTTANDAVANVSTIQASLNAGTSVTILTSPSGTQNGDITVSNTISKTAGGAATLTLTAANTGTINVNQAISSTVGALSIVLNGADTININAGITTLGGSFSSTSLGATSLAAALSTGAGTVTFNTNTGAGANDFTMTGAGSIATTNTSVNAVAINVNAAGGGSGNLLLGGNITTGSGGRITLATNTGANATGGSISQSAGILSVVGAGSLVFSVPTSGASSIGSLATPILTTSAGGTLTLTSGSGGAFVTNTGNLTLAVPTLASNNPLAVISTATLTLPATALTTNTGDLTLRSNGGSLTTAGNLTTTSGNLTLLGSTGLTLSHALQTGSGNINLSNSISGNITDNAAGTLTSTSGNLIINSLNTLTLAAAINTGSGTVLMNANSDGAGGQNLSMSASGSITTTNTSGSAVSLIVNTGGGGTGSAALRNITTGSGGTLAVAANGGDITQTAGTLLDVGVGTLNLTTNQGAGRNIGTNGANILAQMGTLIATTGNSGFFITNFGATALALGLINVSGAFSLTSTSSTGITQSAAATITGITTIAAGSGQDVDLSNSNNDFATVTLTSGNAVTLNDLNSLILGASTISGDYHVTTNGAITQSGTLLDNGLSSTATFAAGSANNITLNTATNDFTKIVVTSGNDVSLRDTNALLMGASTISGNLTLQTAGALTQSDALNVSGVGKTATFIAGAGNDIILSAPTNDFTSVVITSGNNVTLQDANTLNFGAATSTISGDFNVTSNGALTQSGTIINSVAGKATTLSVGSGNDITLSATANNFATLAISSANSATIYDTSAIILGTSVLNGTYNVTAEGVVTQSGSLTVPTLIVKTLANAGDNITLNGSGNEVTSLDLRVRNAADTANASGALIYLDASDVVVAAANTTSTVNLTAGGNITQSGSMTGTILTLSTPGDVNLNSASNAFSTLAITTANDVTYQDTNAIALGSSTILGNFNLTAGGAITQSGIVTVNGTGAVATVAAGPTNNITLSLPGNDFSTIIITSGNNVSLADTNDLNLGASTVSGTLLVSAGGNLTQSGILTVTGTPTLTLTTPGTDILLASAANNFNTTPIITNNGNVRDLALRNVSAAAAVPLLPTGLRNLSLNFDAAGMTIPAVSLTGNLTAIAAGTLTTSGSIQTNGNVSLSGSIMSLNGGGLSAAGLATIAGYQVLGMVNVGALTLDVSFANLTGTVAGFSGFSAIARVKQVNSISAGTHYFDGLDMVVAYIPIQSLFSFGYSYNAMTAQYASMDNYFLGNNWSADFPDLSAGHGACLWLENNIEICSQ